MLIAKLRLYINSTIVDEKKILVCKIKELNNSALD